MTDDLEGFVLVFPVWALVHERTDPNDLDPAAVVTAIDSSGKTVLICTDKDLAEQFAVQRGDLDVLGLADTTDLVNFLEGMAAAGVTHVKFDNAPRTPEYPIQTAIDHYRDANG